MNFKIKDTLESNLALCTLDAAGNLINSDVIIIKKVSNKEVCEHLGYFHELSRNLRLPYNRVLDTARAHHNKLLRKRKEASTNA